MHGQKTIKLKFLSGIFKCKLYALTFQAKPN
jgi:hypothetical protein